MNCIEFTEKLYDLTDVDYNKLPKEMKVHIAECSECDSGFNSMANIFKNLQPAITIPAPSNLKENVLNKIKMKDGKKSAAVIPLLKKLLPYAAAILFFFVMIPFLANYKSSEVRAANTAFAKAMEAIQKIHTFFITFNMRSYEGEPIGITGKEMPMIKHSLAEVFDTVNKWKVEKPGRVVTWDGYKKYLWIQNTQTAIYAGKDAGFLDGWPSLLLDPLTILDKEKNNAQRRNAKVKTTETSIEIKTEITSNDTDLFNNYLNNKLIEVSNNRREYVFDKKTNLLKSIKVYFIKDSIEILIFETTDIKYDIPISNEMLKISLPKGVEWKQAVIPPESKLFSNITSSDFARIFFTDLSQADFETHKEIWGMYNENQLQHFRDIYQGCTIMQIGEPFKIFILPQEFVPYKIKLKTGEIISQNLSTRNDNPNKVWQIDGGLRK